MASVAGVLEHDHRATVRVPVAVLTTSEGRPGGGEHRHRQVVPVRQRFLALLVGHVFQVVAVALGERGNRGRERGVRQEVVG